MKWLLLWLKASVVLALKLFAVLLMNHVEKGAQLPSAAAAVCGGPGQMQNSTLPFCIC